MGNNSDVLRINAYDSRPSLTFLSVDRARDRAIVLGLGPYFPVYRVLAPLSLIAEVQMFKSEHVEGKPEYGVLLRVLCGDRVKFGCHSREQARTICHAIAQHLGLDHRF
jgi:hypothetical protein